ncbi:MAG: phosphoribosylanthranilate isomerase [Boseongicola sp.]
MTEKTRVKICGLTTRETVSAAVKAGAAYVGFNFFPKSPRFLTIDAARLLALDIPEGIAKVALTVDADDALLDKITADLPLDMLQLHGTESVERVAAVKMRYGLPLMKAVGIADAPDVDAIHAYSAVSDQILVDAKPPNDAELPGGNGLTFDWRLIAGHRWSIPWMLAGGLTPDNVDEAVRLTGAKQVDVSSGVETTPGVKDAAAIRAFIEAAR